MKLDYAFIEEAVFIQQVCITKRLKCRIKDEVLLRILQQIYIFFQYISYCAHAKFHSSLTMCFYAIYSILHLNYVSILYCSVTSVTLYSSLYLS